MIKKLSNIFAVSKNKGIVGAVLAVISLIVGCAFISPLEGIIFALLFAAAGFFKINTESRALKYVLTLTWAAVPTVMSFFFYLSVTTFVYDVNIPTKRLILNALIVLALLFVIFAISGKPRISVSVSTVFFLILSCANVYVYRFRGKELVPTDIFSIGTAANVAGGYDFTPSPEMTRIWLITVFLIFLGFSLPTLKFKNLKEKLALRGSSALAAVLSLFLLFNYSSGIPIKTWETEGSRINGYYLNFFIALRNLRPDAPSNYSPELISSIELKYAKESDVPKNDLPNVIVIMNESFADLSVIGEVNSSEPITPFFDLLTENTVRGYAVSSVYGGNTANAQYEFLTGNSMAFMPPDSVPYQQFISQDTYSLAHYMISLGYKSFATHPYYSDGWSRTTVYPLLGFEEFTFIDSYENPELCRNYVSDKETYSHILDKMNSEEAPLFAFGITMQNHGGYDYSGESSPEKITLNGYSESYPLAEQYISLLHESDRALAYLIGELAACDEETVVLFFGDHLPRIEDSFYEELYGGAFDTLDARMLKYTVPFMIWANYEIETKEVAVSSMGYLSNYLIDAAGLPLPPYGEFLADAGKYVPAITPNGYYSPSKGCFIPLSEAEGEEKEWIDIMSSMSYNSIFDKKNSSKLFYEKYINRG